MSIRLTVGEESVRVGVVKSLGGAERSSGRVAVSQVVSAGNAGQVSDLVEGGCGLVLAMTGAGNGRQSAEV